MRSISRRLAALEYRPGAGPFDHMTDEELSEEFGGIIEQLRDEGMELPDDWREQFDRNPWPLMVRLGENDRCED